MESANLYDWHDMIHNFYYLFNSNSYSKISKKPGCENIFIFQERFQALP